MSKLIKRLLKRRSQIQYDNAPGIFLEISHF